MKLSLLFLLPILIIAIFSVVVLFGLQKTGCRKRNVEHFSSPAVSPNEPSCVNRNADAQAILAMFPQCRNDNESPSEDATDRIELKLILNKLTCLDADVSNNGVSGFNTLYLPYNTSHDTEPITNFVGRCLNGGARTRDIDLIMTKYENRGLELIKSISKGLQIDPTKPYKHYKAVISVTYNALVNACKMDRTSLDRPVGVRDPGYSIAFSTEKLAPFARTMD
jgi:hypothetical protein